MNTSMPDARKGSPAPHPTPAELRAVGRGLRMAREARGLSLRELAQMVGCSHSHLSRIERGQATVTWTIRFSDGRVAVPGFGDRIVEAIANGKRP